MTERTDHEVFDKGVRRRGNGFNGRFDYEASDSPNTREQYSRYFKRARHLIDTACRFYPKMPPVYFGFIDRTNLDATAFPEEGREFIGVNAGTVLLLEDFFSRMLSHPQFLASVFPSEQETVPPPLDTLIDDSSDLGYGPSCPVAPVHPERRALAGLMIMFAFDFLVQHEFAHLLNGHVRFDEESGVRFGMQERMSTADCTAKMLSQAMEMDADAVATNLGIATLVSVVGNPQNYPLEIRHFYQDMRRVTMIWLLAVHGLARLFGSMETDWNERKTFWHPPPRIRQRFISGVTQQRLRHGGHKALADDVLKLSLKIMMDIEVAVSLMTGQEYDPAGLPEAMGQEADNYMREIVQSWADLRPELEQLRRGPVWVPE